MVLALSLLSVVAPVLSSDLIDSANLLQAKKKSKISRKQDLSTDFELSAGEEDCTGKDMWMWLGDHREKATHDNTKLWVKQTSHEFSTASTVMYAKTGGKTCKKWCEARGQVCVRGMDDAHHQVGFLEDHISDGSRCTIFPAGHTRRSTDEAGCRQAWATQMCACGEEAQLDMGANECAADENTDSTVLFRACGVTAANPNGPYDHVHPLDLIFKAEDGDTATQVDKNENGNLVITSTGEFPVQPLLVPPLGREVILPESFIVSLTPVLKEGESFTVHDIAGMQNKNDFAPSGDQLTLQYPAPATPLQFNVFPPISVNGENVEVQFSATGNVVADCNHGYTHLYDNKKVKYQSGPRLWRRVGLTLDSCYEACAADARCKYFSFDDKEGDKWEGCCMGGTVEAMAQSHTYFKYYEVCRRSDVRAQCDQHDEHSCHKDHIITEGTMTAQECHDTCKSHEDCALFGYEPTQKSCQICGKHHKFKGRGQESRWAVMGKECEADEVAAKFA